MRLIDIVRQGAHGGDNSYGDVPASTLASWARQQIDLLNEFDLEYARVDREWLKFIVTIAQRCEGREE